MTEDITENTPEASYQLPDGWSLLRLNYGFCLQADDDESIITCLYSYGQGGHCAICIIYTGVDMDMKILFNDKVPYRLNNHMVEETIMHIINTQFDKWLRSREAVAFSMETAQRVIDKLNTGPRDEADVKATEA